MNINLPGGKGQPANSNSDEIQVPSGRIPRVVRLERLNKMSDNELQSKINRLPEKLKKKADVVEKRVAKLREALASYEAFKKSEAQSCKEILDKRKKSVPNGHASKAA